MAEAFKPVYLTASEAEEIVSIIQAKIDRVDRELEEIMHGGTYEGQRETVRQMFIDQARLSGYVAYLDHVIRKEFS